MLSHKSELGDKDAALLTFQLHDQSTLCEKVAEKPTNGVSFGPQISASQVKKSDSEIGPASQIAGLYQ